ncbi:Heavy metal-associated isoprenylated plant protein 26 [Spatholobus suberectus]|nr:Heavy metal-associated isoprenylated plant protein 26 [Spatholobus suberectus]
MAAKPAEEAHQGETLKYQTWVLKVLIHCEGCKRRVKKILQGIDGVYTTEVDSLQHKVTVTGNVDAETLIKRLSRSGKLVELWPQKPAEKKDNKKSRKSKGGGGDVNKEKEDQKNGEPVVADGDSNEDCKDAAGEDYDIEGHSDECEEGNGGGEGGKKKKKKKKKKNKGENGGSAPPNNGGGEENTQISKVDALILSNLATSVAPRDLISPPIQHAYPYPQVYYSPPPAYELSYNTTYPISSSSYYVGAPIMPMHAYTTAYSRFAPPPPPSDPIKHHGDEEDEYEGGYCSIM